LLSFDPPYSDASPVFSAVYWWATGFSPRKTVPTNDSPFLVAPLHTFREPQSLELIFLHHGQLGCSSMSLSIADGAISSTGGSVEQIHPDRRPLLRSTTTKREVPQRLDTLCEICKQLKPQHLENAEDQDIPRPSGLFRPDKSR
jgi:hypothetical protein